MRNIITKHGGNLATNGSVSFLFTQDGRLPPRSGRHRPGRARARTSSTTASRRWAKSTGEKGEPQLVIRCAFADFGKLQEALEARKIAPLSAEHEYICTVPTELPEAQATEVLELIDKLEQDDDVQKVFHTLA